MRSVILFAAMSTLSLGAADNAPAPSSQPVDRSKLPDVEQRTVIPLPSERLTPPLDPKSTYTPPPSSSRPLDAKELEKREKDKNWMVEGMQAKRTERELPAAEKAPTETKDYIDGYVREQQLLQGVKRTPLPDDGTFRPALGAPTWSDLGIPQNSSLSGTTNPSLSNGFNPGASTAQPFVDASLTINPNQPQQIKPLLGPPQQANNEYRPPSVPGVNDAQSSNIKLISRDPNAPLPTGYIDPVDRLRNERQQSSQPTQPTLTREEIEQRLNETSRPRPKASDLRRTIPDPTNIDF